MTSGNPAQHDITINGVQLDFIQHGKDRDLYMKVWDDPESGFPKELFQKIEKATTTTRPFYDNIYISVFHRPCVQLRGRPSQTGNRFDRGASQFLWKK